MSNAALKNHNSDHYQSIVDTLPTLIWLSDKNSKPVYFNKSWLNFTGKASSQEALKTWKQLIHENDINNVLQTRKGSYNHKSGYELKYRLWNENSQKHVWIKELGEPRFDNDKFDGFIASCTDIQEHYDLIFSLTKSEERFKELYNKTPVMLHSINPEGKVISVSDFWLEKMGYTRKEVLGQFSSDFLTDESRRIAKNQAMPEFFEKGSLTNQNYQFVKKNGEVIDVLLSATAEYNEGKLSRSLAVINDITDIKKTDDFLQNIFSITSNTKASLKDKISAILEVTTEFLGLELGIVSQISDNKYSIEYIYGPGTNYAAGQKFSLSETLCRYTYKSNRLQSWEDISKVSKEEIEIDSEFMSYIGVPVIVDQEKYGSICFSSTKAKTANFSEREQSIIRLIANWISNKLSILKLINELKESENDLSQLVDELQSSNLELERFAYVAAHDLQEPIRSLRNFTTLLSKEQKDTASDTQQQYVKIIYEASTRMQKLVSDLLDYSRIENEGKNYEEFELDEVLDYVQTNLMDLMRVSNAQLNYNTGLKIKTDPVKLSRLLQNLISNGIKYTETETKPIIDITCTEKGGSWEFCIKDNGIGIDKKFHETIFAPFKRLHSKDAYPGSGIGLSICKKIVESLGGKIWIKSSQNKGSSFFFSLPKS